MKIKIIEPSELNVYNYLEDGVTGYLLDNSKLDLHTLAPDASIIFYPYKNRMDIVKNVSNLSNYFEGKSGVVDIPHMDIVNEIITHGVDMWEYTAENLEALVDCEVWDFETFADYEEELASTKTLLLSPFEISDIFSNLQVN